MRWLRDRADPSRALGRHGLPGGLAGEQIPLPGRIAAVCDVFDALLAKRPYKESWTLDDALVEMRTWRYALRSRAHAVVPGDRPRLARDLALTADERHAAGLVASST